ncbi:hypothetical protein WN55_05939 [Dufourea novaeangliae]|uniref:Uncharacterized protein n=1 Tax=Dufourea novaeangliae TaxID=178035 RepID=A0A154PQ42_DUFNO|nr:hypothetical protein WN55_05939 [Dufourea novaeangliae]
MEGKDKNGGNNKVALEKFNTYFVNVTKASRFPHPPLNQSNSLQLKDFHLIYLRPHTIPFSCVKSIIRAMIVNL